MVIILFFPCIAHSDNCDSVKAGFSFSKSSLVESDYFEQYYIEKSAYTYYISALRLPDLNFFELVSVMNNFDKYPDFMPGYIWIEVQRFSSNHVLTGISFEASFFEPTSQYTTDVDINSDSTSYRQCWWQLDAEDTRIIKTYKMSPFQNKGNWEISVLNNVQIKIKYFTTIQPSMWLPDWAYRRFAKNSYTDTSKAIIKQAKTVTSN